MALSISLATLLSGCGIAPATDAARSSAAGASLQGRVHGGQQAVSGASISLYAAGLAGNGLGAVNLLGTHTVVTDANGGFNITGDFSCPAATTPVYLVARGGNPGLAAGTSNPSLVLVAALGDCGTLTSATFTWIDEATTAAAAWALTPFWGPGASVGASVANLTGLRNAFGVAANLVNTTTGVAPSANLPAGASTETSKLNTLANVLSPCVNSDGNAGCSALFAAASTASFVPANTLDAALNIVRNPAANVAGVFNVSGSSGPFQPALTSAPHDWTMSLTLGNCASGCGGLNVPGAVGIDSTGSVWVANYFGAIVSNFSAAGVAAAPQGFPGAGLHESYGLTVDPFDHVWITNQQSVSGAGNRGVGSVSEFNSAGLELSSYGYTGGGIYYPLAVAADSNGEIWIADYGSSSSSLLASNGSAISGSSGYGPSQLPFTSAVALDAVHNAWFAVEGGAVRVSPLGAVSSFSCCSGPSGIAVDPGGNIWIADYNGFAVVELTSTGAFSRRIDTSAGLTAPQGIAVDGAGNIWTSNYFGNSITFIQGSSGTMGSPPAGLGLDAPLNEPYGIAIDAGGNLWLSNSGGDTVTEFLGLAKPVHTPLLGPPVQP